MTAVIDPHGRLTPSSQAALCDWARAHGIDPEQTDTDISIEDGVIHYNAFVLTPDGRRRRDPATDSVRTVHRTTPLHTPMPNLVYERQRVVLVRPGDTLFIGNLSTTAAETEQLAALGQQLRQALGVDVIAFEDDIDIDACTRPHADHG
ncbi:hypothetical protein [Streptomyces sp. CAU 1734]|uniref:hypothetical protein n=1 Tax=Streptomyces sp. CAU 1734 TaxID=3140360 RepID=UPI003261B70C